MAMKQNEINDICILAFENAVHQFNAVSRDGAIEWKRLRYCTAQVAETPDYYLLKSYNTIVAVINKSNDTCYDVLRYTYGYTATSAQHIAKFRHDYGSGKWGCEHEMRYR